MKALRIARAPGDVIRRSRRAPGGRPGGVARRLVPAAVARAIGRQADDWRPEVGESAPPRRAPSRLAILAVRTTIAGAAFLFATAGLRSEVLQSPEAAAILRAPAAESAASAAPETRAAPPAVDLEPYLAHAATSPLGDGPASEGEAGELDPPAADGDAEPDGGGYLPRVFLHYSELEPGAERLADRIAGDLGDRGVGVVDIRAVGFTIGVNRIRYFFDDDAAAAPAIGAMIGGSLGPGGGFAPEVQDFTHFEPKPPLGTIEVWLTGSDD